MTAESDDQHLLMSPPQPRPPKASVTAASISAVVPRPPISAPQARADIHAAVQAPLIRQRLPAGTAFGTATVASGAGEMLGAGEGGPVARPGNRPRSAPGASAPAVARSGNEAAITRSQHPTLSPLARERPRLAELRDPEAVVTQA